MMDLFVSRKMPREILVMWETRRGHVTFMPEAARRQYTTTPCDRIHFMKTSGSQAPRLA